MKDAPTIIFSVGGLYTHEEIFRSLRVGNVGGVRFATAKTGKTIRGVLFTSVPEGRIAYENPYHDRIENNVLVYTAQGKSGEQGFGGMNQRLLRQEKEPYPLYCFQLVCSRRNQSFGNRRWKFLGMLSYVRHYKEQQLDVAGKSRTACIVEFDLLSSFHEISTDTEEVLFRSLFIENSNREQRNNDDKEIANTRNLDSGIIPEKLESIRFSMLSLHPRGFENIVRVALERAGFENVFTTRYSQDGGIDVNAFVSDSFWPLRNLLLQVQAKRWIHAVGRKEIAELRGSLGPYARGALITTSFFSKSALNEANSPEKLPIVTIDGYDFARIVDKLGITIPKN